MPLHIQSDSHGTVCRLYDARQDNPNELNIVLAADRNLEIRIEDRDGGNNELSMVISPTDLRAALAALEVEKLSVLG